MRAKGQFTVLETVGSQALTVDVKIADPLVRVKITSKQFDVSAQGAAKRMNDDDFNLVTGYDLAFARALYRLGKKIERHVIKGTEA